MIRTAFCTTLIAMAALQASAVERPGRVDAAVKEIAKTTAAGPYNATWDSLEDYEIPKWYEDAKFGIFIHWGVYSVPAFLSEWYPRMMYIDQDSWRGNAYQHHKETHGDHKKFGYKDFIPDFKAEKFDPDAWAKLFKDSGARYVVPVAEHHDGFPLYDCSFTKWNSVEMGPKRDIIADLAKSVRDAGLYLGVSSHRAFNWAFFARSPEFDTADPENFGLYGRDLDYLYTPRMADYQKNPWPDHDQGFKDDWLARTCEMVDKFQPDLIWFDFGIAPSWVTAYDENPFQDHIKEFTAYYYNKAAADNKVPVVNYKFHAYPEKAAVLDLERSKLDKTRDLFWQTDTSVSKNSWGFVNNHKYKEVNTLVDDLVDIVSKNGCMLLNIGPRPDGTIPEREQEMLLEIGEWLKLNGEAIYESRPYSIFGEGPTGVATGHLSEKKNKDFTADDVRFTTNGGNLYAILLGWPESGSSTIRALASEEIGSISMIGSAEPITWTQDEGGLTVKLPSVKPCKHAFVLKIEK